MSATTPYSFHREGAIMTYYFAQDNHSLEVNHTWSTLATDAPCPDATIHFSTAFKHYGLVVEVYLTSALCLFGFVGNVIAFLVLRRDKQTTTTYLLQTLAVLDTFYLITTVFTQIYEGLYYFTGWFIPQTGFYPYMEMYLYPCARMVQMASSWAVVLVTVERFVSVCRPHSVRRFYTLPRIKVAMGIIFVLCIAYNIPNFFEVTAYQQFDRCQGIYLTKKNETGFYHNRIYQLFYKCILQLLLRYLLPLSVLIVLNCKLFAALRRSWRKRHQMKIKSKPRKSENITLMLITVVIVFVICQTPNLTLVIVETLQAYIPSFHQHYRRYMAQKWWYYIFACNLLLTINSSVNFLIYCLMGKRFRMILMSMMCVAPEQRKSAISGSSV